MLSPSDIVVRPASLAERIAAEVPAEPPALPEPTPTTMAERFAPEAQKGLAEGPVRPAGRAGGGAGTHPGAGSCLFGQSLAAWSPRFSSRWSRPRSSSRFCGKGAIKLPGSERHADCLRSGSFPRKRAGLGRRRTSGPRRHRSRAKPEIVLTAPGRIEASTGDELDFDIAIDSAEVLPARSVIAIRAMPEGATFSQGRPYGDDRMELQAGRDRRPAAQAAEDG